MAKFCENCGKELHEEQAVCLNCGKLISGNSSQNNQSNATTNSMALSGFIVAVVSIFLNFWGIGGIIATILSAIGLSQINSKSQNGKGLAIAGLCIGIFSIILGLWAMIILSQI